MNFKKIILLACLAANVNQSQAMIPASEQSVSPVGLTNSTNKCYANSLIQCLFQYPKFRSIERISELSEGIEDTNAFNFPLIFDNEEIGGNPITYMLNLFNSIQINRESIEHKIHPSQDGEKLISYSELDLIVCPLKRGEQLTLEIETFDHEGYTYKLTGILCNTNDTSSFQHYYSYVKHNGSWFLCDDEKIINLSDLHRINSLEEELIPVIYNDDEITISYYTTAGTESETVIMDGESISFPPADIEHTVNTKDLLETVRYNPKWIENFSRKRTNLDKYTNPTPLMLFYKKETPVNRSRKRRGQIIRIDVQKRSLDINSAKKLRAEQIIKYEGISSLKDLPRLQGLVTEDDINLLKTPCYLVEGSDLLSELGLEKLTEIIAPKM